MVVVVVVVSRRRCQFSMKITISRTTGLMALSLVRHDDDDVFAGVGIGADEDDVIGFCAGFLFGCIVSSIARELVAVRSTP